MSDGYAFGPFEIDVRGKRLLRQREGLAISARHFDLLLALVANAGDVLSKDRLIEIAWRDVAVTDNSLEQAISNLRKTLESQPPDQYIRTEPRRGYRFAAPVTRVATRPPPIGRQTLTAPMIGSTNNPEYLAANARPAAPAASASTPKPGCSASSQVSASAAMRKKS